MAYIAGWLSRFVICLALSSAAFALTPAEKLDLQSKAAAVKAAVDALAVDVPPAVAWPRIAPDLLDIDLVNERSIIAMSDVVSGPLTGGARWLDPSIKGISGTGNPQLDDKGLVFHYSDLSGIPAAGSSACDPQKGWTDWRCKFTSWDTCQGYKWGVEPNGLHYLESCTDGGKETYRCNSCRVIDWKATRWSSPEVFWREVFYASQDAWDNQTEIGQKLTGVGGALWTGGTFAEIFEIGKKNPLTGGWALQAYRYDAEGAQGATVFTGVTIWPGIWYVMEGHVKVPSCVTCADGVMEFKVDGKMVFARSDVRMGALAITGFNPLRYHGGTNKPAGPMHFRIARIALSRKGWIGPPPEIN
jgi:hypothetical protein